jgi:pimeloyl-ACP methyl ester carboxylesterase
MIPFRLRLAAALLAPALILRTGPAPAQATAPATRLPHVSVTATGRGAPVILIPGLSSPRAVWDPVVPALARTHRVYLVQVNGFGGDAAGANLSPGVLAGVVADLHGLIARERIAGAAVVGHSLGGLVALMLAKAHPGDAGRLMIIDALPYAGTMFVPDATVAMVEPQARAMRDRMAAAYGRPADPAMARVTAERLATTAEARAKVAAWSAAADPRVAAQALYEDLTTDLRPDLAAIATPITLVYPYSDALPQARADAVYRDAYRAAPRVAFVPVGASAHFVMLDQPAAFAAALDAFLR